VGQTITEKEVSAPLMTFKDGSYLPEAEAANSEVLLGSWVDPSIGAGIPGGKLRSRIRKATSAEAHYSFGFTKP
jgi:hypothetical protein